MSMTLVCPELVEGCSWFDTLTTNDENVGKHGRNATVLRAFRASVVKLFIYDRASTYCSSLTISFAKLRMPSANFSVAIASSFSSQRKPFSSRSSFSS